MLVQEIFVKYAHVASIGPDDRAIAHTVRYEPTQQQPADSRALIAR